MYVVERIYCVLNVVVVANKWIREHGQQFHRRCAMSSNL